MTETNIKDMTMDQVREICIINSIKKWREMSLVELQNIDYDPSISIPQISLDTIKTQMPVLSENSPDCINLDIDSDNISKIKEIYGNKFQKLDEDNIKKIKMPGTYYILLVGLNYSYIDLKLHTTKRDTRLTKMTFISYDKTQQCITAFYKNKTELLYCDYYGNNNNNCFNYLCEHSDSIPIPPFPIYIYIE